MVKKIMCYLFVDICCNGRKRIYYNFLQEDIFGASFYLMKYIWFKKVIFQTNLKFWILDCAAKDAFCNFETNHLNVFLTRYDWTENEQLCFDLFYASFSALYKIV